MRMGNGRNVECTTSPGLRFMDRIGSRTLIVEKLPCNETPDVNALTTKLIAFPLGSYI